MTRAKITEPELARIVNGIIEDRESILKHNPIGTREETLLWMLLGVLSSYLDLTEIETPCFTGMPNEQTYREAILFVLNGRKAGEFEPVSYLDALVAEAQNDR